MNEAQLIQKLFDDEASFCIFKEANSPYKFYYHPEGCLKNIDINNFNGFVFHPFEKNGLWPALYLQPSLYFESESFEELIDFLSNLNITGSGKVVEYDNYEMDEAEYKALAKRTISTLGNSSLEKVVISRIAKKKEAFNPFTKFQAFNNCYPNNFNYIFNSKESGCWIGSSPERFLKIQDNHLLTTALAGTLKTNENWTFKEREEQSYVEEYLESILKEHQIDFSKTFSTLELKNIKHLNTSFEGKLDKPLYLERFLNSLHPTPAVGGIPKEDAITYISFNEPHDRMYYTGFAGEVCPNKGLSLFVNLRSMQMNTRFTQYFIGGGLTIESNVDKEFMETEEKLKSFTISA